MYVDLQAYVEEEAEREHRRRKQALHEMKSKMMLVQLEEEMEVYRRMEESRKKRELEEEYRLCMQELKNQIAEEESNIIKIRRHQIELKDEQIEEKLVREKIIIGEENQERARIRQLQVLEVQRKKRDLEDQRRTLLESRLFANEYNQVVHRQNLKNLREQAALAVKERDYNASIVRYKKLAKKEAETLKALEKEAEWMRKINERERRITELFKRRGSPVLSSPNGRLAKTERVASKKNRTPRKERSG